MSLSPTSAINAAISSSANKTQASQGISINAFLASLSVAMLIFTVEVVLFVLIRGNLTQIYKRVSDIPAKNERRNWLSRISCIGPVLTASDTNIIPHAGLDAYFFLRYLRTLLVIFIPMALVIIPILVPLNYKNGKNAAGTIRGLDQLSWSNVIPEHSKRYWAHFTLAVAVVIYVCFISFVEFRHYVFIRRKNLLSSTTVLITAIPPDLRNEAALKKIYDSFPGGLSRVRMNRDLRGLSAKIEKHRRLALLLEEAETTLVQNAAKVPKPVTQGERSTTCDERPPRWTDYLRQEDREFMRLPLLDWMPSIPLLGKRVDKINYCREELAKLATAIQDDRNNLEDFPYISSAFVEFKNALAAHMACQCVAHHLPKRMVIRHAGFSPQNVIWENISITWWERYVRGFVVLIAIAGLIIGWVFPVTMTGLISQITYITSMLPWLGWINTLPGWALGAIQGVLPPILLALLMAAIPVIMRVLANQQGETTADAIELSVQNYYFVFLFVQVFLVVSLSAGITTAIKELSKGIRHAPTILAENLPKASNYFFSYMLLQAFSVSGGALVQISSLINRFILAPVFDHTARQKWIRQRPEQVQWGTFFPVYTNLACIGLIYSIIAPVILIFNITTFGLFWIVYRYNTLYVANFQFDTGGRLYPKALNQLYTGIYFMELCLIGLFILIRDSNGRLLCTKQAIGMTLVTLCTAIYQFVLNQAFDPLFNFLPINTLQHNQNKTLEQGNIREQEQIATVRLERGDTTTAGDGNTIQAETDTFMFRQRQLCGAEDMVVWLPDDKTGVSQDEVERTLKFTSASNSGAWLEKGKVVTHGDPPRASLRLVARRLKSNAESRELKSSV